MKKKNMELLRKKLKKLAVCIKRTAKKGIDYANKHKIVYVISGIGLALVILLITILAINRKPSTGEVVTELVQVQVGIDNDGNPVYETREVLVTPSASSEDNEEILDDPVVLAYRENAKNGYMNNCIFLGDSRTVAAVSYGFLDDDKVLAQIGISHMSVATNTFIQN